MELEERDCGGRGTLRWGNVWTKYTRRRTGCL